jgi:hypothetical protein
MHPPGGLRCPLVQGQAFGAGRALELVRRLLAEPRIALENPVSVISSKIRKPDQIIQPWQFGHGETKATCLWLKGLPKLEPTNIVEGRTPRCIMHRPDPTAGRNAAERWLVLPKRWPVSGASDMHAPPDRARNAPPREGGTTVAPRNSLPWKSASANFATGASTASPRASKPNWPAPDRSSIT